MKFLFFTDTHIRGTNPRNRLDNFYETLKNKFIEIGELINRFDVDFVLHGGDWFDRPDISPAIVREFAVLIKNFNRPIYSVAGNHDIYGHNPSTLGRTMLGLLEGLGVLYLLNENDSIVLEKDGIKVQLTGRHYQFDMDGENYRQYYIVPKDVNVNHAIHIVHGMLLEKPFYEGIQHTLIKDILDNGADITLAGHYHNGFGVRQIGSKYFVNPGSLVRISNSPGEISRAPEVVLIEAGEALSINEIQLSCAKNGEEVLSREQLLHAHDRNVKLFEFYQGLESEGEFSKIRLDEMIEKIALLENIGSEVKEEAIRRISAAQEVLGSAEGEE